ncbi:MAG TPA: hypothetical protein VK590_11540 [Saprospiraceae bacterium]|nr:hypothetical protein [Saprospiraceae bacterium]
MIHPVIALYVIAAIMAIDLFYRIAGTYSIKKILMPALKKWLPSPNIDKGLHEPDTLIETWQDGYVISLKTFFQKLLDDISSKNNLNHKIEALDTLLLFANEMQVIKEMKLSFFVAMPDAHNYHAWICVLDNNTKEEWKAKA